ncbi:hypothetical protein BGZ94_002531 [Podila epigama]|nr:hypothetical protein BGZ94_002531 [Podila epigama]
MSLLLDVVDPSIHFHARHSIKTTTSTSKPGDQAQTSSISSMAPVLASKGSITAGANISPQLQPSTTTTTTTTTTTAAKPPLPTPTIALPAPHNIFSAMSKLVRTSPMSMSGSSTVAAVANHFLSSSPPSSCPTSSIPSLTSSATSSPALTPIATPSEFLEKPTRNTGFYSASTSPWLIPNVCDDEQMNKLVSFQL